MRRNRLPLVTFIVPLTAIIAAVIDNPSSGQEYYPSYSSAPPVGAAPDSPPALYAADQLDQILGPIALYPDPLLSQILAASTYSQDVASAEQWLQYNPNPSDNDLNSQSWDPSVKGLVRFPDVLAMMANNMDWTQALGTAFAYQQNDVMDSVQRLRVEARNAQTLASTPQQQVVDDSGIIDIVPAQPDVIYVPQYDPDIVYAYPGYAGTFLTFGPPCPFGAFLDLGLDFRDHRFIRGARFDRDNHRFDFDHGQDWHHDSRRPITTPVRPFFPPKGPNPGRGWSDGGTRGGAFNPSRQSRTPVQPPKTPERPVTGLPRAPARNPNTPNTPARVPNTPARTPTPAVPSTPAPRVVTPTPKIPRSPNPPSKLPTLPPPRVSPIPTERPVTGITPRAPMPRPTPAPTPPAVIRPNPAPAPSSVFRPSSGSSGASSRGRSSMRK